MELKNKNNRITLFDSLKGIAILGIILVHSSGVVNLSGVIGKISAFGARGVQMFFIISAILTFRSLESTKKNNQSIKSWYFNRFLRIIPLYYISLIFYYFTIGFNPNYWSGNGAINGIVIVLNILLLHGLHPFMINAINVNWYIGTLTLFTIIAPILFKKINNLTKSILFFVGTWIIALFFQFVIGNIYTGDNAYLWLSYWTHFSLISELPIIAIGIILYFIIYKGTLIKNIKEKCIQIKTITNVLTFCIILSLAEKAILGTSLESCSMLFGILILIQIINKSFILDNKIFSFFGKYSYGIYLFHYPIVILLTNLFSKYSSNVYLLFLIVMFLTTILSTLISYILTNLIEKPIIKIFKNKAKL